MKHLLSAGLLAGLVAASAGARAADHPITLGVLNDMSGTYADYQGRGSVVAAEMAAEDFGKALGQPVKVLSGDHQNKADIGSTLARQWFDQQGVDVILDVPNSGIALAVAKIAQDKNKVFIGSGAGSAELTGKSCSPNTVHWTYDTWQVGHALGRAVVARGGTKWFFLTADYTFGYDLEASTADAVRQAGGTVLGALKAPLGTPDFSSLLLQAQGSGANVLGLTNAGGDTVTSVKQAAEFGLNKTMTMAGPVININMIQALGLPVAQGALAVTPFYWDMTDATRAFAKRFAERHPQHLYPNDMQAGVYASVLDYLKAVTAVGSAGDGRAVVAEMKKVPGNDPLFGTTIIRPDGRAMHPIFLMETKSPAESKGPWDFLKLIDTIPADKAFRPLDEGGCPLAKS